ncbi:MAG: metal-dependent transcriptional regulator, partial [Candidatus Promineifilaceae bacterium]
MADQNIANLSESEEMYLVTAVQLAEAGMREPISLTSLAQALSIQPASANEMVRKLAEAGFLNYIPYKGVNLLTNGRRLAQQVLRSRRLWELFLVRHLELPPTEADALACRLEHITPKDVAERLYLFLERPSVSSQGLPIPPGDGTGGIDFSRPLNQLMVN